MDVMVLGHKGMLGHMVAKYLIDKGCNVVLCESRFPTTEFGECIKQYNGNYIINCVGAIPQRTRDFSINHELPKWLDVNANCNIIHPGTDCEMDSDDYGVSKKLGRDYIVDNGVRTKILKTSIIGPEINSHSSLMEWFLSQEQTVSGYTKVMWNGNTTLEWAEQCYNLMDRWNDYGVETILEGECVSKYQLLKYIGEVFKQDIDIIPKETESVNKCLKGDIKTEGILAQLKKLKAYYMNKPVQDYCISIPTFSKRQTYIKNLIESIRSQSIIDIYLCVNCDYNEEFNEDYRKFILNLSLQYDRVFVTFYLKFRGLTKMWNDAVVNGCKKYTCIMNDDSILTDGFVNDLIRHHEAMEDKGVLKVNNGWACFVVSKDFLEEKGFFNEYYIGIGFEDCDFVSRNGEWPSFLTDKFIDLANQEDSYKSFPKNGHIESQHQKQYSSFNRNLFNSDVKPEYLNPRPCEQYYTKNHGLIFQE